MRQELIQKLLYQSTRSSLAHTQLISRLQGECQKKWDWKKNNHKTKTPTNTHRNKPKDFTKQILFPSPNAVNPILKIHLYTELVTFSVIKVKVLRKAYYCSPALRPSTSFCLGASPHVAPVCLTVHGTAQPPHSTKTAPDTKEIFQHLACNFHLQQN